MTEEELQKIEERAFAYKNYVTTAIIKDLIAEIRNLNEEFSTVKSRCECPKCGYISPGKCDHCGWDELKEESNAKEDAS
jgi:hypothetical protein